MNKLGALITAGALLAALPAFGQTVSTCPTAGSAAASKTPWVLFDLGSAALKPEARPVIAEAAATARRARRSRSASSAKPTSWATRR